MQQFISWFFRSKTDTVASTAKDRMRAMLVYDRLELPAGRLECLEEELIAVVSRYFELEKNTTKFDLLQQQDRKSALVANFPLLRSKC